MISIKFLFFFALAVACVFAVESERVKKDVLLGAYPYASPYAYSAGHYSAGYVPTAYSGYAYPSAYSAYPYGAGLYRSSYLY